MLDTMKAFTWFGYFEFILDEEPHRKAALSDVETQAEGHYGFVHHHGREDGQHVLFAALKTNGKTLAQAH